MRENAAHVIDGEKKIGYAVIQIHMRALQLECSALVWAFLPGHSVASELPRPDRGT